MSIAGDSNIGDNIARWLKQRINTLPCPSMVLCRGCANDDDTVLLHLHKKAIALGRNEITGKIVDLYFGYPEIEEDQLIVMATGWTNDDWNNHQPLSLIAFDISFHNSLGDPNLFDKLDSWLMHVLHKCV